MLKPEIRAVIGDKSIPAVKANTFFKRFMGLMCRKESDYGLLLDPCNSVHTCFMRFDLDILFLDGSSRVLKVMRKIKPWRVTGIVRGAKTVLEFPSSLEAFPDVEAGMVVQLVVGGKM